jgi:hypothetical protein
MAITSTPITNGLPGSLITASGNIAVTTMYLCNKSQETISVSVYITPSGGSDYGNNIIYSNLSIAAQDTYVLEHERLLLGSGDGVYANVYPDSSAYSNKVIATLSYTSI